MDKHTHIRKAEFDPKVRTYWLVSGMVACVVTLVGIPLLLLWIPIGLVVTGRHLKRMECVLTDKTLKVKKGIMIRVEKTIPLEKITDLAMVQGPVMRYFGIYKLTVETAGQSGPGALVALTGIVDAKSFREAVLAQRDLVSGPSAAHPSPGAPPSDSSQAAILEEVRDALLRIEALLATAAVQKHSTDVPTKEPD
ncbi:MAG: PH domain-containing protein [Gammaproteobacteria bacterium]|nr:PH domain-containing protein [Gammaproteobacteria bacterium]